MTTIKHHLPRLGAGPKRVFMHRNITVSLISILGLGLFLSACATGTPLIKSVTPQRVDLHKQTPITAKLSEATTGTQLYLSPGGPYATQKLDNIGPVSRVATDGNRVFAADPKGQLRIIEFNQGHSKILEQRSFPHGIDLLKVIDNKLYVDENNVGLHVFDMDKAGTLSPSGEYPMTQTIRQVATIGNGLLLLSGHHTLTYIKQQGNELKEAATTTLH